MPRSTLMLTIFVLVAALLASGCGEGGEDSLTKAEFVKRANAICKKSLDGRSAEYAAYVREKGRGPTTDVIVTTFVLPSISKAATELDALVPPKEDEEEVDEFVAAIEAAVKKSEADPASFEESPGGSFTKVEVAATKYGLASCVAAL